MTKRTQHPSAAASVHATPRSRGAPQDGRMAVALSITEKIEMTKQTQHQSAAPAGAPTAVRSSWTTLENR
jgi:hypothetical protein